MIERLRSLSRIELADDRGLSIAAEHTPRLAERFYRAEASASII